MIFEPLNGHVEVKPLEQQSIVLSQADTFEEKGEVLAVPKTSDGYVFPIAVGEIVYFDSWLCAKYPDSEGHMRYLVPLDSIRAKEYEEISK